MSLGSGARGPTTKKAEDVFSAYVVSQAPVVHSEFTWYPAEEQYHLLPLDASCGVAIETPCSLAGLAGPSLPDGWLGGRNPRRFANTRGQAMKIECDNAGAQMGSIAPGAPPIRWRGTSDIQSDHRTAEYEELRRPFIGLQSGQGGSLSVKVVKHEMRGSLDRKSHARRTRGETCVRRCHLV